MPESEPTPTDTHPNAHKRTSMDAGLDDSYPQIITSSPLANFDHARRYSAQTAPIEPVRSSIEQNHEMPLNALSMAAEQAAMQDVLTAPPVHTHETPLDMNLVPNESMQRLPYPAGTIGGHMLGLDFEDSLENLSAFLDNGPLAPYHYSSMISTEQPMPFFSPESIGQFSDPMHGEGPLPLPAAHFGRNLGQQDEGNSFSRFGSRLPSLQPEERPHELRQASGHRPLYEVSLGDRQNLVAKLAEFSSVVPSNFQFPSRLAMSRYIAGFINGFHEHLPFLHVQTMSMQRSNIELILAMAAIGAQYCFEGEKGVELFQVSQAIAGQRIRRRDARLATFHQREDSEMYSFLRAADGMSSRQSSVAARTHHSQSMPGPLGLPSEPEHSHDYYSERENLMQTSQALLLLMAMATWAKHKEILREALAIQSVLATLVRDDGLRGSPLPEEVSWEEWIAVETTKRTKFIVFCFFNLHCIVYNIPSLILSSEIKLILPCSASEFKAPTAARWREARKRSAPEINFQDGFQRLFSKTGRDVAEWNSSLGNYVLIHAVIQHIFLVRQIARTRFDGDGDLALEDMASLENALRNWQLGWKRNPESSLDPLDPNGPVAFNSTALLRLAYIRLNMDTGPGRALDTRDPVQIANAFQESPPIKRTPKLVRAVLHSAHALSIPVKIGIRLVAQTQTFHWSIQHSLCSLECAFLLSKWLGALALPNPDPVVTDDERRISSLVRIMLDETEFAVSPDLALEDPVLIKQLSAGVLRVWAKIFKGAQTWAIVDVIGSSLNIYADMLEAA
jgi:Fungal specific transcription factor domain